MRACRIGACLWRAQFQAWHDPSSNKVPAALVYSRGVPLVPLALYWKPCRPRIHHGQPVVIDGALTMVGVILAINKRVDGRLASCTFQRPPLFAFRFSLLD